MLPKGLNTAYIMRINAIIIEKKVFICICQKDPIRTTKDLKGLHKARWIENGWNYYLNKGIIYSLSLVFKRNKNKCNYDGNLYVVKRTQKDFIKHVQSMKFFFNNKGYIYK